MIVPKYESFSIVNLISTLLNHYGIACLYPPLPNVVLPQHQKLVFIVIDGLGYKFLKKHGLNSHLERFLTAQAPNYLCEPEHKKDRSSNKEWERNNSPTLPPPQVLTSVFPSTTAAGLTSLMTGVAPLQHGLTGWFMYYRELATAGIPLPFNLRCQKKSFSELGIYLHDLYQFQTIFNQIHKSMVIVAPQATTGSPFSNYCYQNKPQTVFDDIEEFFHILEKELTHSTTEIIYAYLPYFDSLAHKNGVNSSTVIDYFHLLDRLFKRFIDQLDQDTLVILTADHGMLDTSENYTLQMINYPELQKCLILPLCGEPRMPFCYVRPSKIDVFRDIVDHNLYDFCQRYTLQDMLDRRVFGLFTPNPKFYDRVGDEILVMKDNFIFYDQVYQEEKEVLIGCHGGVSEDEMLVPLIIIKK